MLGKHSGRHAFGARLAELGWPLEGEELARAFERFKALADRKKQVADADIVALAQSGKFASPEIFALVDMQVACGTMGMATATVRLRGPDGEARVRAAVGTGPVDACFKAICVTVEREPTLLEYTVHAVTEGMDALGEVSVRVRASEPEERVNPQNGAVDSRVFHGHGADMDIIVASAKAYLSAVNRLLAAEARDGVAVAGTDGVAAAREAAPANTTLRA